MPQAPKLNDRESLIKFKLERILYQSTLKESFKKLSEHAIFAKIFEKEKKREMMMNLKALKFWSLKTKYKVFIHCIQKNVETSQLKR